MRRTSSTLAVAVSTIVAAGTITSCGRGSETSADSALRRDLNLVPRDSAVMVVSPEERRRLDAARARASAGGTAERTATRSPARARRSSSGEVAPAATPAPASSGTRVVKHPKRDAAIGAAAGAVIGGATHGVKGAVVGGAAGAVVGAIIGNNVDKKKKKVP